MDTLWNNLLNKERARIFKSLGHPLRLAILDELKKEEYCVHDLEIKLGVGQSNLSRHLALLKQAGIIDCHKKGLYVYYFLTISCVVDFFTCVNKALTEKIKTDRKLSVKLKTGIHRKLN